MTETLYKYRSLNNFKNFVDIVVNNRLYAASYKDLNDPMEGQYYYNKGDLDREIVEKLRGEKQDIKLCSLSKINNNQLMWSHYADGHCGVAIGVIIDDTKYTVRPIVYDGIINVRSQNYNNQSAHEILSHKLGIWNYEQEVRVFTIGSNYIKVQIKEIVLGYRTNDHDYELVSKLAKKINSNIEIKKTNDIINFLEL